MITVVEEARAGTRGPSAPRVDDGQVTDTAGACGNKWVDHSAFRTAVSSGDPRHAKGHQ